jgi:Cu(I)/Ag(I) efflux system protein CusF
MTTLTHRLSVLSATLMISLSAFAQTVDGTVEKIDADSGKITLRHGEIKSIDMPPMKMAFRVADPKWLQTLQVGDKVKFDAAKVNGQFTVTAITVVK